MNTGVKQKSQANFLISIRVLDTLKVNIPARLRSKFVEEAIERALKKEQFLKALNDSSGTWSQKDYKFDTEKFIRSLRESTRI